MLNPRRFFMRKQTHKPNKNWQKPVLLSTAAALSALSQAGFAQEEASDELPPVMVISQAPETETQSVTLLSGDTITLGGISEVRDIQTALPNFTVFDANNTRMPKFSVRGLRENSFGAGQSAVGMYVDGVPYSDMLSRGLSLYDVDHIEFLRGPQGSRFGAGAAPGGVVSIKTREPGADWGGNAGLSFGDHNSQEYRLNASGPISESLGVSISGLYNDRDGFIKNVPTGSEIDSRETTAGRLQFVLKPSDPWTLRLSGSAERYDDGFMPTYNPLSDVGPHKVNRDFPGYVDSDVDTLALTAEFDGSQYDFSSVTAYRSWEQDLQQDFDFTAKVIQSPQFRSPLIGVSRPDVEQFSQELNLKSKESNTFNWALGAYYSDRDTDNLSGKLYPIVDNFGSFDPKVGFPDYTNASMNDEDQALFWEGDLLGNSNGFCEYVGGNRIPARRINVNWPGRGRTFSRKYYKTFRCLTSRGAGAFTIQKLYHLLWTRLGRGYVGKF